MTSHELARKLLEGSDVPVELKVQGNIGPDGDWDAFCGDLHDIKAKDGKIRLYADVEGDEEDDWRDAIE